MSIRLSDHFSYGRLLRFTLPSIAMMIFVSIYGVVDGLFISNYVGKTPFAAVNIVMPFIMVLGGVGAMLGSGGSALVSKTLGEGDTKRAQRYFTMIIRLMLICGVLLSVVGIVFIRPVTYFLGADDAMIGDCVVYARTVLVFNAALMMQYTFQSFLITAEKPRLGLAATLAAGFTNMGLDALFVAVFRWGVFGAALATGVSYVVGGGIPLAFFLSRRNRSPLRLVKSGFELRPMLRACGNGSSEMLSSVSGSIMGILYNRQLMAYAGENGVAAYGIVMYASFIFIAVFVGYSNGSAPIVGYHYGAGNLAELKNMLRKSLTLVIAAGVVMTAGGLALSHTLASIFIGYDAELMELSVHSLRICFAAFLVMGINIYASSFFTALNNGAVSAGISFLRALVLPMAALLLLPLFLGLDGIWISLPAGEYLALAISLILLLVKRQQYGY